MTLTGLFLDPRMALGIAGSAALAACAIWILFKRRLTPEEKERRRLTAIDRNRRTVEGFLTETAKDTLYYHYELAGVEYSTSQDVAWFAAKLPDDLSRLIGPVSVKYDPRNPANSIIISEVWSGLPAPLSGAKSTQKEEPACN